jgi:hypothetical protein
MNSFEDSNSNQGRSLWDRFFGRSPRDNANSSRRTTSVVSPSSSGNISKQNTSHDDVDENVGTSIQNFGATSDYMKGGDVDEVEVKSFKSTSIVKIKKVTPTSTTSSTARAVHMLFYGGDFQSITATSLSASDSIREKIISQNKATRKKDNNRVFDMTVGDPNTSSTANKYKKEIRIYPTHSSFI